MYKSKMVERIELLERSERERCLTEAGYNVFNLDASDVYIDLLTDSGTGAMSDEQWAALISGDEAYAGSESFARLREAVSEVMGFEKIVPAHQGRGAENVLYGSLVEEGDIVLNNTHFDTTRAHIANNGGEPIDCPVAGAEDSTSDAPFKGNFSVERGSDIVDTVGAENVPIVIVTITNNSTAGQPISMENLRDVRAFADEIDALFVVDACRFAENAYFIQEREEAFADTEFSEIVREQLSYPDVVVMSGKKDGIVNIGGFIALEDGALFEQCKQRAILYEGFPTYGGMAGRDLAAMAVGLREAVDRSYVEDRTDQIQKLAGMLRERNVPIYEPVGSHAVYIVAGDCLSHIPDTEFPGQALVCEFYREGGVRAVELGSFAFPGTDRPDLVRLALPRRVYHYEHLEHIAKTATAILERSEDVPGYEIVTEPARKELRHFSAELQPVHSGP